MNTLRYFVLILLFTGLYTNSLQAQSVSDAFEISGNVTSLENKGIANVVVSDGYLVTTTDNKGQYTLQSNSRAKHVFISIPADYKVPNEGNISRFYKAIKGTKSNINVDFTLTKQEKDKKLALIVMADPQAQIPEDIGRFTAEPIPDMEKLKSTYSKDITFIGLTVGDLLWDAPAMYPAYVKAFQQLSFPYFQVIGNHDHDQKITGNDYAASHIYESYFGPTYYSFNRGECHFIVLDNIIYNARKKYIHEITQEQLNWLQQDLNYVDKNKFIIVGMHAPAYKKDGKALVTNQSKLEKILQGYNVIFISGHTHRMNKTEISKDMVEYTLSPTMGNSWAGDLNVDGCPNGYGVFEIDGNKLVNQYFMSTSHTPDYQMRVYPVGSVTDFNESVVANVWNYSQGWKVEVVENGVNKGNMVKIAAGYDPIAYNYYIGPEKPTRKPELEPAKTPNLFYFTPKDNKSEVKVVVTDNFGKVYTEYINRILD